ncbi:STAS-like domain-containing protein [Parapedobacter sp. 2B3]|uniref:STAS-like domain-containing protein n=1 Tax=Parapedobacter sp. 2B3 TaxID=3342381 RepID=UPI0035B67E81
MLGKQLSTRIDGAVVREKIAKGIEEDKLIVLDFDGVDVVSNSFADECFAKLMLDFDLPTVKAHTTFKNATPFIKAVIANSFKERLHVMHTA